MSFKRYGYPRRSKKKNKKKPMTSYYYHLSGPKWNPSGTARYEQAFQSQPAL